MSVTYDHKLKTQLAKDFINQYGPIGEDKYFLAIAGITGSSHTVDSEEQELSTRKSIVMAKRILQNDASLIIPRYDWTSGITMSRLRSDVDMSDTSVIVNPFYVTTPSSNFRNVYICLENNEDENAPSLYEPIGTSTDEIILPDGFRWKFLFTIPDELLKFRDLNYIPVRSLPVYDRLPDAYDDFRQNQYAVQYAGSRDTTNGTIQAITITSKQGFFPDARKSIAIESAPTLQTLSIDVNGDANDTVGYYVRFLTGPAAGEVRKIVSFTNGRFNLDEAFTDTSKPNSGDILEIGVGITITGNGSGAKAFANVNSDLQLENVIVYSKGQNYSVASAEIDTPPSVSRDPSNDISTEFSILVTSPIGGDPEFQLLSRRAALAVRFNAQDEQPYSEGILGNDFRDVIIWKNPEIGVGLVDAGQKEGFKDNTITTLELVPSTDAQNFSNLRNTIAANSNTVILYGQESNNAAVIRNGGNGVISSISTDNLSISLDVLNLRKPFEQDETVVFLQDDGSGTLTQLSGVGAKVFVSRFGDSSVLTNRDYYTCTTGLGLEFGTPGNYTPSFDSIVSGASGSDGTVARFTRDNVDGNLNTVFLANIDNKSGSTFGYSVGETVTYYAPEQARTVTGTITNILPPELDPFSGETLYIEGLDNPVTRVFEQEELFKFIFEF
jgi:hypothetical protein